MDANLQRRVQRYGWDKAAAYYEKFWEKQLKVAQDKMLETAMLEKGDKVIDIACGSGLISFRALEQIGKDGYLSGNDISEKMITMCRQLTAEKNIANALFERMDSEELATGNNEFDVALNALGLMYAPDPLQAIKEMHRVIKPGGRAVALVWGQRDHCGWADIFEIVDKRVSSEVCPMFFNLGNKDVLKKTFEDAGFKEVSTQRISTLLQYDSADDACGAAFAGGPVALAYNKFTDDVKKEAHAEYIESIKPWLNGRGYAIPGEFVIAIGYK
jgi:ubiquinone/menaquinone biosynthesis C-methylase UbiE